MNEPALERHRSLYTTFVIGAAIVVGLCFLALMRLPGNSLGTRLGLAAVVIVVNVLFALMMNVYPRLGGEEKPRKALRKPLVPYIPDPDGLRWITAGAWTLCFALMWLAITAYFLHGHTVWTLILPLVLLLLVMATVDLTTNIRLFRAAGRPVTGLVVLYTLGELLDVVLFFC